MRKIWLFILVSLLAACATSTITRFDAPAGAPAPDYAATDPGRVEIYRTNRPAYAYQALGLITMKWPTNDLEQIYQRLRTDAGKQDARRVPRRTEARDRSQFHD